MGRVYRQILSQAPKQAQAAFLDTPAGFELGADNIAAKASEYFSLRLGLALQTISFRNKNRAFALDIQAALRTIRQSDFILAGPGSPSYAIRNLAGTPVWQAIQDRWERGSHLVFASAAAIATSTYSIPVYEIFKAGAEPYWLQGLDLLARLGLKLAIVPHWNNSEGGMFDTRFCFMGELRFRELEAQLDPAATMLGIDEHTACIIDPRQDTCTVMGIGTVTIRGSGQEWVYSTGESFPLSRLQSQGITKTVGKADAQVLVKTEPMGETPRYLVQLAQALSETVEPTEQRELIEHAHDTMHELASDWLDEKHKAGMEDISPLVETMLEIRRKLREAKQYALADEIRASLAKLNIVLEDKPGMTTWRRV